MSDWYWKVIVLKAAFVLSCFASYLRADDNVQKLPFCNPSNIRDGSGNDDLIIVSTLDGKLTAFSTQNGIKAWDVETQPLLSSNLHHLELSSGGKWVRLVPSLRGTLYSLSGETIEPLPFDAEQLLSASYKYSDDLVIAGARESLWVGIDASTGGIVYECGSRGCSSERAAAAGGVAGRLLVLRRHSHTVRALDPRAGTEKWNFSVAEHQLALSRGECEAGARPTAPIAVAVALHDGRVAVRNVEDYRLIWQHKLEAPVAGMWRLQGGALRSIDVVWEATRVAAAPGAMQPSLYVGLHNTQLYIQESPHYARKLETSTSLSPVPWKLISGRPMIEADTALTVPENENALAQVALYGSKDLIGDYGFFLYLQETCDQSVQTSEADIKRVDAEGNASDDHEHHHIHVHVYSLWFWWKEVLVIAISSGLLMNLMIWPRFFAPKTPSLDAKPTPNLSRSNMATHYEIYPNDLVRSHRISLPTIPPPPAERSPSVPEYSGRYESDFTPLRCLGRGGFGVVFEVRNNIDHCCYALKRITLPQKEKKRERVRREVRALAKLEHVNIVRYFNAWEERPPPPAQQERDTALIRELDSQSTLSEFTTTPLSSPAKSPNAKGDSVILNLHKPFDTDLMDYRLQEPSKRNRPNVHQAGRRRRPPDGKRSLPTILDDATLDVADKHVPSLSCSDSIIFDSEAPGDRTRERGLSGASTGPSRDHTTGHSGPKDNSMGARLPRVQECDYKTDSSTSKKKKKGHTRHWSLDACVKGAGPTAGAGAGEGPAGGVLYLYIQMQLCRRDSLHDWLREKRESHQRNYNEIKSLFSQIVSAVDYVHKAGLIHRDLKPSNILFSQDGVVKVGDFGLVTSMGDASQEGERPEEMNAYQRHTYRVGTHLYMSPEQMQCRPYSYKVDIYSLGLILFELLQPFGTESERVRCLEDVKRGHYPQEFRDKYPNEVEALQLMLSVDPAQRPTALGVRARAPLFDATDERHHFTLPAVAVNA